uniref:Putative cd73 ecto-5'-nucleotidase n=1 Tax=Ixodes ricinus TaxID=34613 RepID=A0A6B0U2F3_IXORI
MKTISIVIFMLACGSVQCSSEGGFNITVLHTNDIHSRFLEANKKRWKMHRQGQKQRRMLWRSRQISYQGEGV